MGRFRVQSVMHTADGLPKNYVTNTWSFGHATAPDPTAVLADWETFMRAISGMFPDTIATTGHDLKIYNIDDPEPRMPMYEGLWGFASTLSGATLPAEAAICVSFRGVKESGLDMARRRGRMFLGPCDGGTLTAAGLVSSTTIAGLVIAFEAFVADLNEDGCTFSVYSRTDDELVPVVAGWIDNAFDTIRSRGPAATTRTSMTLA